VTTADPRADVQDFLRRHGLRHDGEPAALTPLTGGVSSDLWRVDLPGRTLCVKRALAQLKVEKQWRAPTSRNRVEYQWLQFAGAVAPGQVPQVLAHDERAGLFAMQYLPPQDHPVWKAQLLAGRVHPRDAAAVGDLVGRLHAAGAADPNTRVTFATDENFDALRIDPYFRVTAHAHPDLAYRIDELATSTAATHLAVVHGDVSPKNILLGPNGPVLLDAECGWFGDPAFDLAFCLNHLLLKAVVRPGHVADLHRSARALLDGHARHIDWEPADEFTRRVAALLPLLALARVDGASPVEYLDPAQRRHVRALARTLLRRPAATVDEVLDPWMLATGVADTGSAQVKEPTP
jgi:tRNA A-37 threonylcarbamoyl transferase component Bud32